MKKIKIKSITDKRIFCLYAALNAAGYDREIGSVMHEIRRKVRDYLFEKKTNINNLANLFRTQPQEFYYPFRVWTLCHSDPPIFQELSSTWKNRMNPEKLKNYKELITSFWNNNKLETLWNELLPIYRQATEQCEKDGRVVVDMVLDYLKIENVNFEDFVIIPNFLDSHNTGLGPLIDNTAYAILGPSENGFSRQRIGHEFLHSIINPLTAGVKEDKTGLSDHRECLIHSIIMRTNERDKRYYSSKYSSVKNSYPNIDSYLNFLTKFEKSGETFGKYLKSDFGFNH